MCPSGYEDLSMTGTDSRLMRFAFIKSCVVFSQALTRALALCREFGEYDMFLLEIRS